MLPLRKTPVLARMLAVPCGDTKEFLSSPRLNHASHAQKGYGPRQFPEKLIPLMILNGLEGRELPIYGSGENVRDWLYVEDHAEALALVLEKGKPGGKYNIGGLNERTNIEVVEATCDLLDEMRPDRKIGTHRSLIRFVTDRRGHDQRYAIDASRIRAELGWQPREYVRSNNVFYFTDRVYTTLRYLLACPDLAPDASFMFCDTDELLQVGWAELVASQNERRREMMRNAINRMRNQLLTDTFGCWAELLGSEERRMEAMRPVMNRLMMRSLTLAFEGWKENTDAIVSLRKRYAEGLREYTYLSRDD